MGVDILKYDGKGYKPIVDFNDWRVAILNPAETGTREAVRFFERHLETDEVFVLLKGSVILVHAGEKKEPSAPQIIKMEPDIVYNVRQATWHTTIMEQDSKILIVENKDTSRENSEMATIPEEIKNKILSRLERE